MKLSFEDHLKILEFFHLEEDKSARPLLQVLEEGELNKKDKIVMLRIPKQYMKIRTLSGVRHAPVALTHIDMLHFNAIKETI